MIEIMDIVPGSTGDMVAGEVGTQSCDYEDECADCLVAVMLQRSNYAPGKFR